jgi:hypothetical protein
MNSLPLDSAHWCAAFWSPIRPSPSRLLNDRELINWRARRPCFSAMSLA